MTEILHLSTFLHRPIFDSDGGRIGRVQDVVARLGDNPHPPVVGAVIRIEGRDLFVPIRKIGGLSEGRMTFEGKRVDLRRFERRPGEMLLAEDLLARHLINLVRGRLITANEIEIAQNDNKWEVVGVDPGKRPFLRRILGKNVGQRVKPETIVDFASIEPFVAHVPTARLRIPYRKLSKLHPAQIADLVEQASHEEGEEIIEAVGADRELEADVFEELDTTTSWSSSRTAATPTRRDCSRAWSPTTRPTSSVRSIRIVVSRSWSCCPTSNRRRSDSCSPITPTPPADLMNPDFVSVPETATVADALDAIRTSRVPAEALHAVFVMDENGQPIGAASIAPLVRAQATRARAERFAYAPGSRARALGPAPGVAKDE